MSELNVTLIENEADSTAVQLNRKATDGDIIDLQKDGSTVGSIGTGDPSGTGNLEIESSSNNLYLTNANGSLFYRDNASTSRFFAPYTDAVVSLGNDTERWKNLWLSGGVYLGGTDAANYLDDYEEGTFTPILIGSGGDPSSTTYGVQSGKYTKVGNIVFAQFQVRLDSGYSNGSGQIRVSGLPFNANHETMTGNVALEQFSDKVDNHCTPVMANGSSQVRFLSMNLSGGWSYIQWGDNTSATLYVFGSVSYTTDS